MGSLGWATNSKWLNSNCLVLSLSILVLYSFSLVVGVISDSLITVWFCMELGVCFLVVVFLIWGMGYGSLVVYYVVQTLGSCVMVWGVCVNMGWVGFTGLLIKVGLFPFSVWVYLIVLELDYKLILLFVFGLQKILPLVVACKWLTVSVGMVFFVVVGCFVGLLGMFFSNEFMVMLASSSIMHTSWLVLFIFLQPGLLYLYCAVYFSFLFLLLSMSESVYLLGLSLMASVPPLLGFILKWMVFSSWGVMLIVVIFIMVLMSGVSALGYFRWVLFYSMESSSTVCV